MTVSVCEPMQSMNPHLKVRSCRTHVGYASRCSKPDREINTTHAYPSFGSAPLQRSVHLAKINSPSCGQKKLNHHVVVRLGLSLGRRTINQNMQDQVAWKPQHNSDIDLEESRRDSFPRPQKRSLKQMAVATRLSLHLYSRIFRGLTVPHPWYWERLGELVS